MRKTVFAILLTLCTLVGIELKADESQVEVRRVQVIFGQPRPFNWYYPTPSQYYYPRRHPGGGCHRYYGSNGYYYYCH